MTKSFFLTIVMATISILLSNQIEAADWVDTESCSMQKNLSCYERRFQPTFENQYAGPICRFTDTANNEKVLGSIQEENGEEICQGVRYFSNKKAKVISNKIFEVLVLDQPEGSWSNPRMGLSSPEAMSDFFTSPLEVSASHQICRMLGSNGQSPQHVLGTVETVNNDKVCRGVTYKNEMWTNQFNGATYSSKEEVIQNPEFEILILHGRKLIWPVIIHNDPLTNIGFKDNDPKKKSKSPNAAYDGHNGIDIGAVGVGPKTGAAYYQPDAEIIAAAAGKVIRLLDGEEDTCGGYHESKPATQNSPATIHTVKRFIGGEPCGLPTFKNTGGNYVVIDHDPNGLLNLATTGYRYSAYCHMQQNSIRVEVGDYISQGQTLGLMGSSGNSTGPHLHFEIGKKPGSGSAVWEHVDPFSENCKDSFWGNQPDLQNDLNTPEINMVQGCI